MSLIYVRCINCNAVSSFEGEMVNAICRDSYCIEIEYDAEDAEKKAKCPQCGGCDTSIVFKDEKDRLV